MNSINILYIANDSSLYGANQSLLNMLRSFSFINDNHKINFHVIIPYAGPIEAAFNDNEIPYTIIPYRPDSAIWDGTIYSYLSYIPKYFLKCILENKALKKLVSIIVEKKIQIIHSNSSVISIGLILSKQCKIKHVWHIREYLDIGLKLRPFRGMNYLIKQINESDAIISITKPLASHYKVKNKNSFVIFDAVSNENSVLPVSNKDNYFLFCGSLTPNKGVHLAINSFNVFHKSHPDFNLLIAGTSSGNKQYERYLKILIANLGLASSVHFLGFKENINELMNKAQALLMCSQNEGMGRVTPEAMLNSCLVIGFNNSGTKELIKNNITGLLFENENELSGIMSSVVENKIDSFHITQNAFSFAKENFLEENYCSKILKVYTTILS